MLAVQRFPHSLRLTSYKECFVKSGGQSEPTSEFGLKCWKDNGPQAVQKMVGGPTARQEPELLSPIPELGTFPLWAK